MTDPSGNLYPSLVAAPKPPIVDTPEKAAAYARSLLRDLKRMEKIVAELPDYFEDLPTEAQVELLLRLANLRDRMAEFLAAR